MSRRERERKRKKSKRAVLTGFLQISGSLTAMESNGAGRAESITGHNRFSHRLELGKAVLYCSTDSWHKVSTGKGAGRKKNPKKLKLLISHKFTFFSLSVFLFNIRCYLTKNMLEMI